ncbi:hypothetical protein SDC9_202355 [bioreactor metagenome]|uniref:Uncharacterized protein n=1 Tax=bioreactor metagenome TaxID=1076179 RepID=A0A645ITF5_9ZZZZ
MDVHAAPEHNGAGLRNARIHGLQLHGGDGIHMLRRLAVAEHGIEVQQLSHDVGSRRGGRVGQCVKVELQMADQPPGALSLSH